MVCSCPRDALWSSCFAGTIICLAALALTASVVQADPAPPTDAPYEPPPFTRFPDEPDDLPPLPTKPGWINAKRVLETLKPLKDTTVRVTLGVEAPLGGVVAVDIVLPFRVRIGAAYGRLPAAVIRASTRELVDRDLIDSGTGALIAHGVQRVATWRARLTVKPLAHHGLLISAGVGRIRLSGETMSANVAEALDMETPEGAADRTLTLVSRISVVEASVGWEWKFRSHWVAEARLGVVYVAKARTGITTPRSDNAELDEMLAAIGTQAAGLVNNTLESRVRTPTVSLMFGYEL